MALVKFSAFNVAKEDYMTTRKADGLDKVYYIPNKLARILKYNSAPIFSSTPRMMDNDLILPTNSEDLRIFSAESDSGYAYRVAYEPIKVEIFSEQITTKSGTVTYRDKVDPVPIVGAAWKGNSKVITDLLDAGWMFDNFETRCLFGLTAPCRNLQLELENIIVLDQSDCPSLGDRRLIFSDEEIVLVNKIMTFLFNDSVGKVFIDGSYRSPSKNSPIFNFESGGGGYRRMIYFLYWWIRYIVNDSRTLVLKDWKTSLHPLLANAFLHEILKNVETKGTLFLDTYED